MRTVFFIFNDYLDSCILDSAPTNLQTSSPPSQITPPRSSFRWLPNFQSFTPHIVEPGENGRKISDAEKQ